MQQWKRIVTPIVLLFVTLLLDGVITSLFTSELHTSIGVMMPRLFVLTVIVLALHLDPRHIVSLTLVFGFIYDSYYSGILGIYMTGLTLIAYLVMQLRSFIEPNNLVIILLSIILLTVNEFFIFAVYRVIDLTHLTAQEFMAERLGATLILNTVFIIILSYPFNKLAESIKKKKEETKSNKRII